MTAPTEQTLFERMKDAGDLFDGALEDIAKSYAGFGHAEWNDVLITDR